jgi:hypothetical protein
VSPWSIFRQVKAALDHEDIEGLLASGCPADEYDREASLIESEIAKITDFGKKVIGVAECERIVIDIWITQFGPFRAEDLKMRTASFSAVAEKIAGCR